MGAYGDHTAYKPSKAPQNTVKYNDEGDVVYSKPERQKQKANLILLDGIIQNLLPRNLNLIQNRNLQ